MTATITDSSTGNKFSTTQPASGEGFSGGVLTLADGTTFDWKLVDGLTPEAVEGEGPVFQDAMQTGAPVRWTSGGSFTFGVGLRQSTTKVDAGSVRVQTPGEVIC